MPPPGKRILHRPPLKEWGRPSTPESWVLQVFVILIKREKRRGRHWFLSKDVREHLSNANIFNLSNCLLLHLSNLPLYQGLLQPLQLQLQLLQLLRCHLQMPGGVQPRLLQFQELWQAGWKTKCQQMPIYSEWRDKKLLLWYISDIWRWQKV